MADTPGFDDKNYDVCIVGAGPVGITAALECARRGLTVALVDAGDDFGRSAGERGVHG